MKGHNLRWVYSEIRYLGTYIIKGRQFRCSVANAKRSSNRSTKCYLWQSWEDSLRRSYSPVSEGQMSARSPIWARVLLSAQADLHSLDFVVMRFLMKLFRTANKDIIDECRSFCNFSLPTEMLDTKKATNYVRNLRVG